MRQSISIKSTVRILVTLAALSLWVVFPALAQQVEWERLLREADTLSRQGRYADAMLSAMQALSVAEGTFGQVHSNVAQTLNTLAGLSMDQGRYVQAETLYRRALVIREQTLGLDHSGVAQSLNNLAVLFSKQGQYSQAEPLYKRSLNIMEKAGGSDQFSVAMILNGLADLYHSQGQYEKAESLYKRSLTIKERVLSPDDPSLATGVNNLADLYSEQGQYAQAETLHKRALAIREKALGLEHPQFASSLFNLAGLYHAQGQYAQAEPLYRRALMIREKALVPDHPDVARSLNLLSGLYGMQGKYAQALPLSRRANSIYRQRVVAGGTGDAATREASKNRDGFLLHLIILLTNPDKEPEDKIVDEAFQVVQLAQASGTASAVAKMASRFASGDDALAGLIKRKQDANERRTKGETQLVTAASKLPQERSATVEQGLRDDIALAGKDIETIDTELTRRFPDYQELTRPEPATVGQIRALLKPGEAMLVYTLGKASLLWIVRAEGAVLLPIRVNVKDVAAKVAASRSEMEFDAAGNTSHINVGVLYELYQSVFAPALPYLAGVKHLMLVPSGPLQSLPFNMLVASPPPKIKSDADYRLVDWLAKHYAFSVLPSVSSIQAFRQFANDGSSQEPFAGFGDPLIGGTGTTTRSNRSKIDVAAVFRNLVLNTSAKAPAAVQATEIADVEAIRSAPRLPETADELRAMAKALKSDQESLWLQENATETKIKHLDLSKYRTIAFATHGVMAGEVKGVGESGLILTPPQQGSIEDDGYLSAGEIAKLKLNADWVVLSACNTAAADGTPGAEGLSGLAKAFFYAGARSLLVSHWPVASEATVPLTTTMMNEYEANPGKGKSEAHRKAIMALMVTPDHPEYAHPVFWAPFVVVGEGGARTKGNAGRTEQ